MKQCTDVSLLANVVNMSDTCACLFKKIKSILTKYHFLPVHCCIILSTYIKIIIRKKNNKTVHGRKWYFDGENWFKDSTDIELPNGSVTNNSGLCPTNQNFN